MRDRDSTGATISSLIEARLWFLIQSKLIDPRACRSLKSLRKSNSTGLGSHSVPDEPLEDARDMMLDGDGDEAEAPMFEAYGGSMELDDANDLDLFEEHSLNGIADDGEEPLDDDFMSELAEGEIVCGGTETLDAGTTSATRESSYPKHCRAFGFESGDEVVC